MKSAKSYKILILFALMLSFLVSGFCMMGMTSAFADGGATVYRPGYVSVYDGDDKVSDVVKYADNNIVASVKTGETVKFENQLVLEQSVSGAELEFVVNAPAGMEVVLKVTASSLGENGNVKVVNEENVYDKKIVSEYNVLDDDADATTPIVLLLGAQDNVITVNGNKVSDDAYYQVELIDNKAVVSVEFFIKKTADDASADFSIISVDQKANDADEKYKQTFELTGKDLTKTAYPRAILSKKAYAKTASGYELRKVDGVGYDMTPTKYSLTGVSGDVGLVALSPKSYGLGENDKSITFTVETSKNYITFHKAADGSNVLADFAFGVSWRTGKKVEVAGEQVDEYVNIEEFSNVNVISGADNKAPYYNNLAIDDNGQKILDPVLLAQLNTYQKVLQDSTMKDGYSIALGEKFDVPSMGNFFLDDTTAFSDSTNLTKKYIYITPSNESKDTTSSKSISIDEIGTYKLYMTASEKAAGGTSLQMESELFYDVARGLFFVKGDNGFEHVEVSNTAVQEALADNNDDKFIVYMFTFNINDDALLVVDAQDQDNGFKGIEYKATKFNITASGASTSYKLYYNSNKNASVDDSGWVEIIAKKKATEDGANGYTYDELVAINYDGSLNFTPDKIGSYKIVCELTSNKSYKTASDSAIIRIVAEPTIVEPANYWFEENLASIIFLGVGALCLIAIVVLLFIKPKNKAEDDE
ncbi:MAG: hypothetical protein IKB98_06360 [Clostridia bacterium]|nr:hypothetical protein [Clostridia bacterium]